MTQCNETGSVRCPVCGGVGHQGRDADYDECGYCHGTGRTTDDAVTQALATALPGGQDA